MKGRDFSDGEYERARVEAFEEIAARFK